MRYTTSMAVWALFAIVWAAGNGFAAEEQQPPGNLCGDASAANSKVEAALKKPVDADFIETPLEDVMAFYQDATGVEIRLDRRALDQAGIVAETPVTLTLKGLSLRSVLRIMLRDMDLTFIPRDETILVTTPEEEEAHLATRVFPVRDLVFTRSGEVPWIEDYDALLNLITATVSPNTWDDVGGPGSVQVFQGTLIISQTLRELDEICTLLATLRKAPPLHKLDPEAKPAAPIRLSEVLDPARKGLEEKLEEPIKLQCPATPLGDVAAMLSQRHGLPILLDRRALETAGFGADSPVEMQAKDVSLRKALQWMLREHRLALVLRDEAVFITTPEEVESELETVIYPVGDLFEQSEDFDPDDLGKEDFLDAQEQLNELIEALVATIAPSTWDQVGGPGSAVAYAQRGALICSQTQDVHEEIVELIEKMRTARKQVQAMAGTAKVDRLALVSRTYRLIPAQGSVKPETLAEIDEIVKRTITPEEWTDEAGAPLVRVVGTRLLVHHRPAAQRRVERLLDDLGLLHHNTGSISGF